MATLSSSASTCKGISRIDLLDGWRTLAIVLMVTYHFLFDLALFRVITWQQMFSTPLNILQKAACCSFILLAGISSRLSRSNLRRGLFLLAAGWAVELAAAVVGQTIRFGILQFLGCAMLIYHWTKGYLQRLPGAVLAALSAALFFLSDAVTHAVTSPVSWLYPLGFIHPGFYSADYFPLLPWLFLFLLGTVLGGWCLAHRDQPPLNLRLPRAVTFPGRHSLLIYLLHQPLLFGISYLIWG